LFVFKKNSLLTSDYEFTKYFHNYLLVLLLSLVFVHVPKIVHLQLCNLRLQELNGKPSFLNPVWYAASFILGAIAGTNEKKWKLGFIEETEKQVAQHLESSIASLPKKDLRSRKFLKEIAIDEEKHRASAKKIGSVDIPENVKRTMDGLSRIMKKISFYI